MNDEQGMLNDEVLLTNHQQRYARPTGKYNNADAF
jgi:hypothetical protein